MSLTELQIKIADLERKQNLIINTFGNVRELLEKVVPTQYKLTSAYRKIKLNLKELGLQIGE